ncbi:MAG: TIGR03960 family B12-binding radical SAM protein [Thermosipho sp. (in: Bacteria)]|nr:TIGR03960 family B12-binding radical SAM protein [Thermosipho sp. (in: thermotogales)]
MDNILKFISEFGLKVKKPARYIGNEFNSIFKDPNGKFRIALSFPDVYEIGMSHYGLEILYHMLNNLDNVYAERVYLPWVDMIELMELKNIPLFTLETKTPVKLLDAIGISLEYELSFTNVLKLLQLSHIPIRAEERKDEEPLVIGGGPITYNPEPISQAFDIIYIGDGEKNLIKLIELLIETKGEKRIKRLEYVSKLEGIYIPIFYKQTGRKIIPIKDVPRKIRKNVIKDLENEIVPVRKILPNVESVHDRAVVEISRGCTRGCRFCQAGYIYRPVRERSSKKIVELAVEMLKNTGYEEISLLSLSAMDHSMIQEIVNGLLTYSQENKISISIPSTRVDAFNVEIASKVASIRKTGITLAPEAGSQSMRDRINKNVTFDEIFKSAESAKKAGWNRVKLYFMVGFPHEMEDDIREIGYLLKEIKSLKFKNITASINLLVPKPHTAFQFARLQNPEYTEYAYNILRSFSKYAKIDINDGKKSFIEGIISRGDRKLFEVLEAKVKKSFYDEWTEFFSFEDWINSFEEQNVDINEYLGPYDFYSDFPWDHIDSGVTKAFLWKEYKKFLSGEITGDCRWNDCSYCGVCQIYNVNNIVKK